MHLHAIFRLYFHPYHFFFYSCLSLILAVIFDFILLLQKSNGYLPQNSPHWFVVQSRVTQSTFSHKTQMPSWQRIMLFPKVVAALSPCLPLPEESKCYSSHQQEWKQAWQTPCSRILKPEGKTTVLTYLTLVCNPAEWICQVKDSFLPLLKL